MGYVYRVEYVDGWAGSAYQRAADPCAGKREPAPAGQLDSGGGTGEIRLEAALLGGESSEEQILFTQAGRLYFARASSARAGRGPVRKASLH